MTADGDLLLVLKSSVLGDGEPDLGERLLSAFLSTLLESETIPARIICMNSAVFLTTEGSPMLDIIRRFEEAGTEIFSCGTCLEYYGKRDQLLAGVPGDMRNTVESMLTFNKVLQP